MAITLSRPQIQTAQLQAWVPKVAVILLALLVAWLLARLTWQALELFQGPAQVEVSGPIEGGVQQPSSPQFNWQNMPVFGKADPKEARAVKKEPEKPKAPVGALKNLNLKVLGIVASSEPNNSFVVIKDKNETRVMRNGEQIRDGITIKTIEPKAFIATDGEGEKRFELEMLAKDLLDALEETEPDESTPAPGSREELPPVNFRVTNPAVLENLETYRQSLVENPMELLGKIRTEPVERDGSTYGFRLYPGRDRTLLTGVGLRPGDILLSVNSNAITDVGQLETIIASLSQSNTIQLTIERGGKVRDINVVLEN
jgi:general secretion pathway protein C